VEHVPEMGGTAPAADFGADHAVAAVLDEGKMLPVEGLGEAGPARARFELGSGPEQRKPAQTAGVDTLPPGVQGEPARWTSGALVQDDVALLPGQALRQFGLFRFAERRDVVPGC